MTKYSAKGKRLADVLDSLNLNQVQFAEKIGMSQSQVNRSLSDQKNVSSGMIEKMLNAFPIININRLFTGVGPVLLEEYQVHELREPSAPYGTKTRCEHLDALRQRLSQSLVIVEHIIAENCQK